MVAHILAKEACWKRISEIRIRDKILHIVYKKTIPNAELFTINRNRVMMIPKCIRNVHYCIIWGIHFIYTLCKKCIAYVYDHCVEAAVA